MSSNPQNADKALLDRLESRLGGQENATPASDPLSELARLIGDAPAGQPGGQPGQPGAAQPGFPPQAPPAVPPQSPAQSSGQPQLPGQSGAQTGGYAQQGFAPQPYPGAVPAQQAPQRSAYPQPGEQFQPQAHTQAYPQASTQPEAQPQPVQPYQAPQASAQSLESDIASQLAQSLQDMDFSPAASGFSQPPERQGFALDGQPSQPSGNVGNPELADLYGYQSPLNVRTGQDARPTGGEGYDLPGGMPHGNGAGNAVHFDGSAPNFEQQAGGAPEFGQNHDGAGPQGGQFAGDGYGSGGFQPEMGPEMGEGGFPQQGYADQGFPGEAGQPDEAYSDAFGDYDAEPEQGRSRRGLLVVGTVLALVVVGGASVFGYRAIIGGGDSVPTIRAADGDARSVPQAVSAGDDQNKLVYDRINGTGGEDNAQLLSRQENPSVAPADRQIRVVNGGQAVGEDSESTRSVRTFSVSPDGQIVQNPEPAAAPEPVVAAVPPAQVETQVIQPAPVGVQPAAPTPQPSAVATQIAQPPATAPVAAPAAVPQTGPVNLNQQAAPVVTAPAPVVVQPQPTVQPPAIAPVVNPVAQQAQRTRTFSNNRNNDDPLADTLGPQARQVAPRVAAAPQPQTITLPPAQAPQSAPVPQAVAPAAPQTQQGVSLPFGSSQPQAAAGGGSVVQIASSRSEGDAQSAISRAQQRYGGIVGNYQSSVLRSDLGSRGVFYRASFGPMSRSEATNVCNRLKANGGDCFVRASGG
jgi:hypothetical protein